MSWHVDVEGNRAARKWSPREYAGRVLWEWVGAPAFRFSPRICWGWRRVLLRLFGADVGRGVHLLPSVKITIPWHLSLGDFAAVGEDARLYSLGRITLGARVTVSHGAHLCAGTHDFRDPLRPLLKPPVTVADDAWVCADAFVGPGVTVGAGSIVGARAVVVRDVPPGMMAVGNPARLRDRT